MANQNNKRANTLRVRLSDDEKAQFKQKAAAAGVSTSELVRQSVKVATITNREDKRKIIASLGRINSNLNMIARWVNTYKASVETSAVVTALMEIQSLIQMYIGEQ
ncbi:ribbon-helix-helix protein, CopG family [Bombella sp. TMW 2.2559]|uniref:Ribbon-helix-helix protein, CopG family n=1 Tax=Bombella dulcis TaxID=2967339 RepID=A0ABT3W9E9_9PROT|nr:ribbon-helix-helix protein, CopG family [Bombella dulcis]MCX5615714.1 ribbon-helix-helix protein, CopG family [Bombella dulcis]